MKRLPLKLTLFLVVLLLLVGISAIVAKKTLDQAEKKAAKQLLLTLNIRKEDIETYYRSVQSEVHFWANNKQITNHLKQKNKKTFQLLNDLLAEQGYDNILLTNPQGKIIYSVNKHVQVLPDYLPPLLKKIKQKEDIYFSDYITTKTTSQQQAFVAAGIFKQKTLLGILLVQLSSQPLTKLSKPLNNTHTKIQTLVVGHDKQLRNLTTTRPHKIQLAALTDNLLTYGNKQTFTIFDQRNAPFLAAFDFAHVSKNIAWVIITKTDIEQVKNPIKKQIYHWIIIGISLLIGSLLIGYFGECWMRKKDKENA